MHGTASIVRTILLTGCALLLATSVHAQAQTGAVSGTVLDETGEPLPGVNVAIVGTQRGTATNLDGQYTLGRLPAGTHMLRASFVGFVNQEREITITAGDTTTVNFQLRPDVSRLDEIVVTGYGQQERADLTGSISKVEGDEIASIPTTSTTQALQGQIAGVDVTPNSGEPGASAQIRIRGVGTLNNASPLFVVDGMLTDDISYLNPKDIESIDVLKDASATAIYGSRGANGVIIVSTKKGEFNQETQYSVSAYTGWQEVMDPISLTNARQYATLANELRANLGQEPAFENPDRFGEGTDWQEQVYRTAPTQNVQLSARGGTETVTYNFSGNLTREKGTIEKSDFLRTSFRANNTYDLSEGIELGHNLAFTYRSGTSAPGVVGSAYQADPTIAPRNEEGEFADAGARASAGNPAASIFYHRNDFSGRRFVGNLYMEASFLDHFTVESSLGLDLDRGESRDFSPEFTVSPSQRSDRSSLTIFTSEQNSWLWENTINYNRDFGNHSIDAVAGVTAQEFTNEVLGGSRVNIVGADESLWYLDAGQQDGQTNFNSAFDWSMLSGLGRVNYSYSDRYLLTASFRGDGSSRFGEDNRWGYFPSFALGWRVSEESFMEDVELINNLKVRASWGRIGNDKIGAYPSVATIASNQNAVFGQSEGLQFGDTLAELANPEVRWEETAQTNVGADVAVFDDRLSASVDYYRRTTDGILVRVPIPAFVGVDTEPVVNAAEVRNSGVDVEVRWAQTVTDDFSFRVGVTGSTTNNDVLQLGQGREEIFGGGLVNEIPFTTRTTVGSEIGAFYGYKVDGVYQNQQQIDNNPSQAGVVPGDLSFVDTNGDGTITSDDKTVIGSAIPDITFGLNLRAEFKAFDVSATLNGQSGVDIFNAKKATRFGIENFETSFLDRWNGEGTSNSEPRITNAGHNYQASEWLLEDGDYLKLRNVQLGYTLPSSLTSSINVNNLRVYVSGTNLVTFTGYSGYTPEISGSVIADSIDDGIFPISTTYTVGIDMSF
jgi:TonB-linked SusC/RagA family outer membrane protein